METGSRRPGHPFIEHIPLWRRVPASTWTALVVGILGFFVRVSSKTEDSGSSGYSCAYYDVAGFVVAVVVLALAVQGWVTWSRRHPVERLPLPLMSALTVLFVALAVVHLLRGTGTVMSECPS